MSGVFVGVFEILKKERNESKEMEWFIVSQRRRRHQKKVKQGEICPLNDFKSYKNYYSNVV